MDPNAVNTGGKEKENKKASFIKKLITKTKSRQNRAKGKVTTKNETK